MSPYSKSLTIAFLVGVAFTMLLGAVLPGTIMAKYHDVIDACEADLPRSQYCEVTAIPKNELETRR